MENSLEKISSNCEDLKISPLLFVGENRSNMAQNNDWSWERCQLEHQPRNCAKQLFEALENCGIDPYNQEHVRFLNAWEDNSEEWVEVENLNCILQSYIEIGFEIVSLGEHVHQHLEQLNISHIKLIHPAARGTIRKKENYQKHVARTLLAN